ncbi:N-terminal nucleophile aminohydrolase [Auriculariales sp. MPI-PUGE-AT-0066]|nr:N-terminal nucleophile aminohydrolase [Auriculariales sp. MPI-PUGE-AT-0066]
MFRNTYDSDNTVFSPQQGSAAVGLRSKTHAILLALKKMFRIDDHVGIAIAGLTSDARVLSNFMRQQAMASRMLFNRPVPVNRLVSAVADKAQVNTQEYGRRPYGVGFLVIGQDALGPHLYEFSPSGTSYEYYAMSIGARSQSAKTYLEKHYESFADCSLDELVRHGLHALRETLQQTRSSPAFKIVEGEELQPFLSLMVPKEDTSAQAPAAAAAAGAAAAPTSSSEDVQMQDG